LIAYTHLLRKGDTYLYGNIWVLTKSDNIKPSSEVFFSAEYSPAQNWEKNKRYLPGVEFLSTDYIVDSKTVEDINGWRRFFAIPGVKEQGSKAHTDDFGVNFTLEKLMSESIREKLGYYFIRYSEQEFFSDKQKHDVGYDFIGKAMTGREKYHEIKSRVSAGDIELTPNETEKAELYKDDYLLCIVDGIPENPEVYIVPNPVKHGKKEKVTIPTNVWRGFKL